jgi:hypothetical protein
MALPQGEGESFAVGLKIRATGFDGQPSANQKSFAALSSPGGEETGEGGRPNKIHSGNRPSQKESRKRAMTIANCGVRIARPVRLRRSGFREKAAI